MGVAAGVGCALRVGGYGRGVLHRFAFALIVLATAAPLSNCSSVRAISRGDIAMSVGTTYDQWLYRGSEGGTHRFVVRSVAVDQGHEEIHEREVAVPAAELPLRATMPLTADRSRWVEFFSASDAPHAVGEGMSVARIRRGMDYIPAPFGPPPESP